MEAIAKSSYERVSPMKVGWTLEHIKYLPVSKAFSVLENMNNKPSKLVFKVLTAAVANATTNHGMNLDNLFVSYCVANPGPIIKRFSPRAKGRADQIDKKTTLIVIKVSDTKPTKGAKK